jgi:hypothetical protein
LPIRARETETEGAFRALGVLRWLTLIARREPGPRFQELELAVASALSGDDSHDHYIACRLGAAVEKAVVHDPAFAPFLREMAAHDLPGRNDEFGHDEIVVHVAAQLRATGTLLTPVPRDTRGGSATPDLAVADVDVEVKHRPVVLANDPVAVHGFVADAMKAPQLRAQRAGILVIDLGRYELPVFEAEFVELIGIIERRLRTSSRLHAVILLSLKRRVTDDDVGPGSWLYVCGDEVSSTKQRALPRSVRHSLSAFIPWAEEVLRQGRRPLEPLQT